MSISLRSATACLLLCCGAAFAAPPADSPPGTAASWTDGPSEQQSDQHVRIRLSPEVMYQGESGLEDGGDVSVFRGGVDLSVEWDISERVTLQLDVENEWSSYSFDDAAWLGGGDDALDDTFTTLQVRFGARYQLNEKWMLFGGGEYRFTGSTDADFGDASTGGGYFGAYWQVGERLSIAAGLSVRTGLDDDLDISPLIAVEYKLSEQWTIGTRGLGVEAEYTPSDQWSFAFFFERESREYRLADDDLLAPGGYFTDDSYLVGVEAGWHPSPKLSVTLTAGAVFGQEYELHDIDDIELSESDGDASPFVGVGVHIAF